MPYNSIAVANRFIDLAARDSKTLTNMQLQKLVFLANGLSLALLDRPITYHNIHAWQWGPVLPQLYKSFSRFGSNKISEQAVCSEKTPETGEDDEVIQSVWKNFGQMTGPQLSALTHESGSPWDKTWNSDQYGIIEPNLIKEFYREKLNVEPAPKTA